MLWKTKHVCGICDYETESIKDMEMHDRHKHSAPAQIIPMEYSKNHNIAQAIAVKFANGTSARFKFDTAISDNEFNGLNYLHQNKLNCTKPETNLL